MKRLEILKGNKISLVVLEKEDIDLWYKGMNNLKTNIYLGNIKDFYYKEDIEKLYEETIEEKDSSFFSIYNKEDDSIIGLCGIRGIRQLTKKGEVYLFIYDEKDHNKGYGKEALELLIYFSFSVLGLNKLTLSYIDGNKNAKDLYIKLGFIEVGIFKEDVFVRGKVKDRIFMELYNNK